MTPIKLKLRLLQLGEKGSIRNVAALTTRSNRARSVGRTTLSNVLNGKECTGDQETTIIAALKQLGIKINGIFMPCTPAEIDEIESYSRNGHKSTDDKIPGFKPVAARVCKQWGITPEELKHATRYSTRQIKDLLFKGPNRQNEQMRTDIENYIARKYKTIRTQTLWNKMEEPMDGQRLLVETVDRFDITNKQAFRPRIDAQNVFEWPAFKTFKEELKEEMEKQGAIAVIGPSGAGKSTFVNYVIAKHFSRKNSPFRIMRPEGVDVPKYTISHLLEALCYHAGDKLTTGSHEARSRQTRMALKGMSESNTRPIMVIEDAHLLDINVILMFKRIMEWEDDQGRPLVGIVLVCQEEMDQKMGPKVKQFWSRTDVIHFPYLVPTAPEERSQRSKLTTKHLKAYITFRLEQAGLPLSKVFASGCHDLATKHLAEQAMDLPLIVNNWLIAAMNTAASTVTKNPQIDRQIIESVNLTRGS